MFANNFICFDGDGRIVAASLGMAKMLGYPSRRGFLALAPNVFNLCASAAQADEFRRRMEEPWHSEYVPLRVCCRDGAHKELLLSIRKHTFSGHENSGMARFEGFAEEMSETNASMMLILSSERLRQEAEGTLPSHAFPHAARHRDEIMSDLGEVLSSVASYARLIEGSAREQPEIFGLAHEILTSVERGTELLRSEAIDSMMPHPQNSLSLRRI